MSLPAPGANVCVVTGTLARPLEVRTLASGQVLASLELRVPSPSGPAELVPVACPAPAPAVVALEPGTEVAVRGRVQRRFFRAGGRTQSRTELVAEAVVPLRQRARVRRLLSDAAAAIGAA
ncbi:MAG: single-stranded DNA-binding protein [Actinomycetota bacterium]